MSLTGRALTSRAFTARLSTLSVISVICVACGGEPKEQVRVSNTPAVQSSEGQSPKAMLRAEQAAAAKKAEEAITVDSDVTIDRVRTETNEALAVADAFLKQQEQKYHAKIDADLEAFQQRIDTLRENAIAAAKNAKSTVTSELTELRAQMISTGSQLGEFGEKSQTELSKLNAELEQMLSVLEAGDTPQKGSGDSSASEVQKNDGSDA